MRIFLRLARQSQSPGVRRRGRRRSPADVRRGLLAAQRFSRQRRPDQVGKIEVHLSAVHPRGKFRFRLGSSGNAAPKPRWRRSGFPRRPGNLEKRGVPGPARPGSVSGVGPAMSLSSTSKRNALLCSLSIQENEGTDSLPGPVLHALTPPSDSAAKNSPPGIYSTGVGREAQTTSPAGFFRSGFPRRPGREG